MAGSSFAGLRMKLGCEVGLTGVPPTSSIAGDVLPTYASLCPIEEAVDGTRAPILDGGINSSVRSWAQSALVSRFAARASQKRLLAGVALTIFEPREVRGTFLTSGTRVNRDQWSWGAANLLLAEEPVRARRSSASAMSFPTTPRFGFLNAEMASFSSASTLAFLLALASCRLVMLVLRRRRDGCCRLV